MGGVANAEPSVAGSAFAADGCATDEAVALVPLDEIEGVKLAPVNLTLGYQSPFGPP